jgi:CheY-like chemotaxis protein
VARILIVDDGASDRLLEQTILTQAGHQVAVAASGQQALMQYLEDGVDVVVTDLHMPEVDGFELIAMLRVLIPTPAIIAVSSMGQRQLDLARELGAQIALPKPIDGPALRKAVEDVLRREALAG